MKLEDIAKLEDNWDQEGAKKISAEILYEVANLIWMLGLHVLTKAGKFVVHEELSPVSCGGIDIEWKTKYHRLIVYIGINGKCYYFDNGKREKIQKGDFDFDTIKELVEKHFSKEL